MATRTGASMGIVAALAFFALLSLVMFVLFVIFAARAQKNATELEAARSDLRVAVRPEEQGDRWEVLKREAGSSKGVVGYLDETNQKLIRMIGGTRRDTDETIKTKIREGLGKAEDEDVPPLLSLLDQMRGRIASLETQNQDATRARDDALADLQATTERFDRARDEHSATIEALRDEIDRNDQDVDLYRTDVTESKRAFEEQLAQVREDAEQRVAALESDIEDARSRIYILEEQLANCRGETRDNGLGRPDEATVVDGSILAANPRRQEVSISLGARDRVVLGMTFEVYNAGTNLRPNDEGEYPPGKAAIEVITVDDATSRARIIRQRQGNPIIEGDILVNPLFDPNKKYVFTVYGNFDTNGDGIPTPSEGDEIRGYVESWGGILEDTITGNTDFLVLGEPPILPPPPGVDDPVEVIDRYLRLNRQAQTYQDLFETAKKTGIPVLNQNRFFTLTGLSGRR